jgi:hypothetical protein
MQSSECPCLDRCLGSRRVSGRCAQARGSGGSLHQRLCRLLLSSVGLAGLLVVLHAHLDVKNVILGKHHYLLYFIATAMYPR